MFCANCQLIFQQPITYYPWHEGLDADTKNQWETKCSYVIDHRNFLLAATKCHCCHAVLRESESRHHSTVSAEAELQFKMKWHFDEDTVNYGGGDLKVWASFRNGPFFGSTSFVTRRFREFGNTWEQDLQLFPLHHVTRDSSINNTGPGYTARFVKKCLEHCKSRHTKCQMDCTGDSWYPTRLVEVLDDGGARVIETSETTPTGPYATLSHCWGTSGIFTASTENIDCLKKHVPLLDLPRTFSDAIRFTKAIGISFIWIDSLCIIQDSVKDWEFESRTMLQVYQRAECNLAAAVSEDSQGGLFSERNYALLPSGWFDVDSEFPELKGHHCAIPSKYLKGVSDEEDGPPWYYKGVFDQEIGSSRLISRGWVYQERAASKRIVAFGADQVFWDCSECLESDVLPGYHISLYSHRDERRSDVTYWDRMGMAVPKHVSPAIPHTLESLDHGLMAWRWIVQRYSTCAFTFTKDRPVAILGVAEMMSNALKALPESISTTYCAGLWVQDMYRQLAWTTTQFGLRKNHFAPSWSWLSIEGPVEWRWDTELDPTSQDHDVFALATIAWSEKQAMKSNSPFCELSADMKIWCTLHAFEVTSSPASVTSAVRELYLCPAYSESEDRFVTLTEEIGLHLDFYDLDDEETELESLYFLPLTHTHQSWSGYAQRVIGILVQPVHNQSSTYRRCGIAVIFANRDDDLMEEILNVPRHGRDAWIRSEFNILSKPPSTVDFEYQMYDTELGYLIHLV